MQRDPCPVVIGATGFTGRLIAHALATGQESFMLASRSTEKLDALADETLSGSTRVSLQQVDVIDPQSLRELIRPGDAVINCAGPFTELGEPVVRACVEVGAHYLDTTGEQPFMRAMHQRYDRSAREAGVSVVNGMAFEYALGDAAVALAARSLQQPLRSVDVIYAWAGTASSVGTRRTSLRIVGRKGWVLEDGRWRKRPQAARRRTVRLASGRTLSAVLFGSGEVVTVPRHLDVETVRGWLVMGRRTARLAPLLAPALPWLVPAIRPLIERLATRAPDPSPADRAASPFTIRVELEDREGVRRSAEVSGRDPYGLTAAIAAAGADRVREPDVPRGVVTPAQLVEPERFLASLRPLGLEWNGTAEAV